VSSPLPVPALPLLTHPQRLLYLSFTDSLTQLQLLCTTASASSIILLILGESFTHLPVPIAWSVSGCALHRLSMIAWWCALTHKATTSAQFRDRARLTIAGHGVAFACVFLTFLPGLPDGLNRLFVGHYTILYLGCTDIH